MQRYVKMLEKYCCGLLLWGLLGLLSCGGELPGDKAAPTLPTVDSLFRPMAIAYPAALPDAVQLASADSASMSSQYQWVNGAAAAAQEWRAAQQSIAAQCLGHLPARQPLQSALAALPRPPQQLLPSYYAGDYYQWRYDAKGRAWRLYKMSTPTATGRALRSARPIPAGLTPLRSQASPDGRYLALSVAGPDGRAQELRFYDLKRRKWLSDRLREVAHTGLAWQEKGVYYARYIGQHDERANRGQQICFHALGQRQAQDELVFADRGRPDHDLRPLLSRDERHLIVWAKLEGAGQALYVQSLAAKGQDFEAVNVEAYEGIQPLYADAGRLLCYFRRAGGAGHLQSLPLEKTTTSQAKTWDSPSAGYPLSATATPAHVVLHMAHPEGDRLWVYDKAGRLKGELPPLPPGTVSDMPATSPREVFAASFRPILGAGHLYRVDAARLTVQAADREGTVSESVVTRVIRYEGYDGQQIPMCLLSKGDGSGKTYTLLCDISLSGAGGQAVFSPVGQAFVQLALEAGALCAVPLPPRRHEAAGPDDLQAAAEYLVANGHATAASLALFADGAAALPAAVLLARRPDLCAAAALHHGTSAPWPSMVEEQVWLRKRYAPTIICLGKGATTEATAAGRTLAATMQHKQQAKGAPIVLYEQGQVADSMPTGAAADMLAFLLYHLKVDMGGKRGSVE